VANTLAIVSRKLFDGEHRGACVGDVLPFEIYRSQNKGLDSLTKSDSLFLVTVRADESLWLVAELVGPKKSKDGWRATTNERAVVDITALIPEIEFDTGKGISAQPGRLGMSLQTPRKLTEADVALLRAGATKKKTTKKKTTKKKTAKKKTTKKKTTKKKTAKKTTAKKKTAKKTTAERAASRAPRPPRTPPAPTPPNPNAPSKDALATLLDSRMNVTIPGLRAFVGEADRSTLDAMFELGWFDIEKWRSTEAILYWVYSYFIALRFGTPDDAPRFRKLPPRPVDTGAHRDVDAARAFVADVLERRGKGHRGPEPEPLPKSKANLVAHVEARICDPEWDPCDEIVAFVQKPRFGLECLEGLRVFGALLEHGRAESLGPLVSLAGSSTILAQVLAHIGVEAKPKADPHGEALLQAVYDAPADDHPRGVYADWLLERNDPRGEVISAQLAGQSPKIADLDAVNWSGLGEVLRWRAPFANERPQYQPRYRRGFLSGALVDKLDGRYSDRPHWSTIELLDVNSTVKAIDRYPLPSLRALGCLFRADLDAVLQHAELCAQLMALGLSFKLTTADADRLHALPALRVLAFDSMAEDVSEHPLFSRLDLILVSDGDWRNNKQTRRVEARTQVVPIALRSGLLMSYDRIMDLVLRKKKSR